VTPEPFVELLNPQKCYYGCTEQEKSFKVIDSCINQQLMYVFLLVVYRTTELEQNREEIRTATGKFTNETSEFGLWSLKT